jgi:hypothetical protein
MYIGLIILVVLSYATALIGNIYLFAASFISLILWLILTAVRLLITFLVSIFSEKYRITFRKIFFLFFFFIYGGLILNVYFLPEKYSPVSLIADVAFFIFTLSLGWILIKKKDKRIKYIGISTVAFCLFIFLWLIYSPKVFQHIIISNTDTLQSLPYATWAPAGKKINYTGVTKYIPDKAYNGINAYASSNLSKAYLIDMQGKILHVWSAKVNQNGWYVIRIDKNGDLFAITLKDNLFLKVDWDSRVKWKKQMIAHHEITISESGDVYILSYNGRFIFKYGLPVPILNDSIVIFSPDGKIKREFFLYDIFKEEISLGKVLRGYFNIARYILDPRTYAETFNSSNSADERLEILIHGIKHDLFHFNSIQIIDRDIKGLCKKGNLLLSARNIDLIAIIDTEKEKVVWKWGKGFIQMQHNASLLNNNNILLFDNGTFRSYSRIIELDPFTKQIAWEYKARPPQDFFSPYQGSCQRLPNGNTLICDSLNGYIFEVTKEGEKVWEFYNPEVDEKNKQRATIYRFIRLIDLQGYGFRDKLSR